MKYIAILLLVSACSVVDHEQDFLNHQEYLESIYNLDNYDPEYVEDCLYYEELVCEFE